MKKRIITLSIALVFILALTVGICIGVSAADAPSLPTAEIGEVIDVWLIAGQSNAIGSAKVENYPTDEAYAEYKALLETGSQNVWYFGNKDTEFVPTKFGQGSNASYSGPEIGIATALDGGANKSAIIKLAYGNTSLQNNTTSSESINYGTWTPPSYIEAHDINTLGNRTGDLYLSFMVKVKEGIDQLVAAGYTPSIKGIWYMQGEADTLTTTSTELYEELLLTLISDMRADISDITGTDCSELPFVYGRILRNADYDTSKSLTQVQAAQDNVAANTSLKNVFMINTSTDLTDPVTGEHRTPVQQDSWHYDSLSQQMIGEKFVKIADSVGGTFTKYGFLPDDTSGANPYAVFAKNNGSYVFDGYYPDTKEAINRASALAHATTGTVDDVVILLVKDHASRSYGANVGKIGGTVTLDLNGHTLEPSVTLFTPNFADTVSEGETVQKKATFNIINGAMKLQEFGVIFTNGSVTLSKTLEMNIDNVKFGFVAGTESKAQDNFKYRDILVSDRGASSADGSKITVNINVTNSELDLVTNALPNAVTGTYKEHSATSDKCYTDYNVTFAGCTFTAVDPEALIGQQSSSGDSVTFIKGDDGTYARVILPESTYSQKFTGIDDGYTAEISLRVNGTKNEYVGTSRVYYLTTASDVETPYGIIPSDKSNAVSNPYAIFKRIDGKYVFDSTATDIKNAFTRATALTSVKSGETDDVVILLRESVNSDSTYPSNITDIAGTVTLDLGGYTIRPTTALLRTDFDDDYLVDGKQPKTTVNIKNGTMELFAFGILFTTVNSNYTVSKTLDLNLDGVKLCFHPSIAAQTGSRKYMDLLVSDRSNSSVTKSYINVTATDCIFDLATNTRDAVMLGTLDCGSNDKSGNNYNVEIIGGKFITDDITKVGFSMSAAGDSFTVKKGADGKYPEVVMRANLKEPASTYYINAENETTVTVYETGTVIDTYKIYELREDVMCKYGRIPESAADNSFAVFVRNGNGAYTFHGGYGGWKLAFEAATVATNGTSSAYDEALVYMLRDSTESSVPYYVGNICTTVNVDLNGKTLTVNGSLMNTYLSKNNGPVATVNFFDGTIRTAKYGFVYTALKTDDVSYETAGVEKTINLNFDNVTVGFAEYTAGTNTKLVANAYGGSTTVNVTVNMSFNGCVIDMITNATDTATLGNAQCQLNATQNTSTSDFNLDFTGCEFRVYDPSQISFATVSETGDSIVFKKDENGYSTILVNAEGETDYPNLWEGNSGSAAVVLKAGYVGISGNYVKYAMEEIDVTTAYGDIDINYINYNTYPFVLFAKNASGGYTFKSGYSTYKLAMQAAISLTSAALESPTEEAVILLRCDFSGSEFPSGLSSIATTVTVDLDGHVLTAAGSLGNTQTGDVKDPSGNIVKTNGTINYKNGSLLMGTHPGLYIAKGSAYTAGYQKTLNVNFDNIYFGFTSGAKAPALLGRIATNLTTETAYFNLKYTGCTIDMQTNRSSNTSLLIGNWVASTDKTDVTVDFIDCDFIGLTEADFQHKITALQDSVRYFRSQSEYYATLTLPKDAAAPSSNYSGLVFAKISENETSVTYALLPTADLPSAETPVKTPYGNIPAEYADATKYPVAVFKNGVYIASAATVVAEAYAAALEEVKATDSDTVVILLRSDLTEEISTSITNCHLICGTLIIDLGGYEYTANGKAFFQFNAKNSTNNPKIEVRNGRLNTTRLIAAGNQTTAICQVYDVTLVDVTLGFSNKVWSEMVDTNVGNDYAGGYALINLTFEDCTFDLRSNQSFTSYTLLDLKSDNDNHAYNVVFKGGEIILGAYTFTLATVGSGYSDNKNFLAGASDGDVVRFEKGSNGYTLFTLPSGSAAPTNTYNSTDLTFVKISDNGADVCYRLIQKAAAEQKFTLKSSITLGSELTFNIYVPINANLTALNLDGAALDLSTLEVKDGYYLVTVDLAAKEAARDIKLIATLTVNGKDMRGTFTFSIPTYAEKVLSDSEISETEKTLVKDVLSYVRAAYAYFGTEDAVAMAKIDALLGKDYDEAQAPVMNGSAEKPTLGISAVTYNLTAQPALRFYLADGFTAADFTFSVKGNTVAATEGSDKNGNYVEVKLYAYELAETVDYTVNGESDSCHIKSYYEWAKDQNNEKLVTLVERFAKYCESAAAYRKSVTK